MSLIVFVLIGLSVQFILAYLTAIDAHKRGQDRDLWFIAVLVFGIFAIIVHLLTRNDQRLPVSERPTTRTKNRLSYVGVAVVGMIILFVISLQLSPLLFPNPIKSEWENCDAIGPRENPDPNNPCEIPYSQWEKMQEARANQGTFQFLSGLSGLILGPVLLYVLKNRNRPYPPL